MIGFTEQMSDWMAAADAMVHSTAGLTVLEAHIRGCPVVSYGFNGGAHLRANNAAFERFGLAEVARSDHELESVLRHVTRGRQSPDSSFASLPSIASRVLTVRPRVKPSAGLAPARCAQRVSRRGFARGDDPDRLRCSPASTARAPTGVIANPLTQPHPHRHRATIRGPCARTGAAAKATELGARRRVEETAASARPLERGLGSRAGAEGRWPAPALGLGTGAVAARRAGSLSPVAAGGRPKGLGVVLGEDGASRGSP